MSEIHQEAFLEMIESVDELPEVNKLLFDIHLSVESLKQEHKEVFLELSRYDERAKKLKGRGKELFELEGVKTLPNSEVHGTLTLVSGKRYIPVKEAQSLLDPRTFATLMTQGKSWVKWTKPKESKEDV